MSSDESTTITSTTTTEVPVAGPTAQSNDRPPADSTVNEIFLDKKCGKEGTSQRFFESCVKPPVNEIRDIKCQGLRGSYGVCDMHITYTFDEATSTNPDALPTGFKYDYNCGFGPGKGTKWNGTEVVPREKMQEVIEYCRQELYGPPAALPLWLILLIIFLVITAVSISTALFWRYWLRKKLYGKGTGDQSSSLGSVYTSAPFSNSSVVPSSGGQSSMKRLSLRSGPRSISAGRNSSQPPPTSSNRSSNQPPTALTIRSSNQPSSTSANRSSNRRL